MPKHKYQRREPTHDWQELRPLLKDPAQISYEIIRPVILFGMTPKERAVKKTITSPLPAHKIASSLSLIRTYIPCFSDAYPGSGTFLVKALQ